MMEDNSEVETQEFALNLILQDEMRRLHEEIHEPEEQQDRVLILQEEDFQQSRLYSVQGEDGEGNVYQSPFEFTGFLDTFVFKTSSSQFRATVEVDDFDVLNRKRFADIQDITTELSHVGAYERDGVSTLSVSSYPFSNRLLLQIEPLEEITVNISRAEIVVNGGNGRDSQVSPELANILGGT